MLEEHKAVILQKYARAWLARRRFQNIRRFVLNIQLTYRVQRLQKKLEDQVGIRNASFMFTFSYRYIFFQANFLVMQLKFTCMSGGSNSLHAPPELEDRSPLERAATCGCVLCIPHKGSCSRGQVGLKSILALLVNQCVLAQSWAALRQEYLCLICPKVHMV